MRLFLDESVSLGCKHSLEALGHDVLHAFTEGMSGFPDERVYRTVRRQRRILVTRDHHFTNPVRFPVEGTPGIIYLRKGNLTSAQEAELLCHFVETVDLPGLRGRLVTISPGQISIR